MSTPRIDPDDTDELARRLKAGELGVVPTDTAYGLAASVERPAAVARVFEVKNRRTDKTIPLLTTAEHVRDRLDPPPVVRRVMDEFWPGALTLVLPITKTAPYPEGTVRDDTLALREPAHTPLSPLLREVGMVTGTSANPAGGETPGSLDEVADEITRAVDFVMSGPSVDGEGSTVAEWDAETGKWIVHRKGPVSLRQLRNVTHDH